MDCISSSLVIIVKRCIVVVYVRLVVVAPSLFTLMVIRMWTRTLASFSLEIPPLSLSSCLNAGRRYAYSAS